MYATRTAVLSEKLPLARLHRGLYLTNYVCNLIKFRHVDDADILCFISEFCCRISSLFRAAGGKYFGAEPLLVALFACSLTDITVNKLQSVTYTER